MLALQLCNFNLSSTKSKRWSNLFQRLGFIRIVRIFFSLLDNLIAFAGDIQMNNIIHRILQTLHEAKQKILHSKHKKLNLICSTYVKHVVGVKIMKTFHRKKNVKMKKQGCLHSTHKIMQRGKNEVCHQKNVDMNRSKRWKGNGNF